MKLLSTKNHYIEIFEEYHKTGKLKSLYKIIPNYKGHAFNKDNSGGWYYYANKLVLFNKEYKILSVQKIND